MTYEDENGSYGDSLELASLASSESVTSSADLTQYSIRSNLSSISLRFNDIGEEERLNDYNDDNDNSDDTIERSSIDKKSLTLFNGISLVVGMQIGSGIFSSPAAINRAAGSAGLSLLVWLLAGLLAWTGASCFVELGTLLPINGSSQAYLAYIYGPGLSWLFSWMVVLLLKPGSAAIIAIVFGEYCQKTLFGISAGEVSTGSSSFWARNPVLMEKLWAILALAFITFLNMMSVKSGATSSNVFFILKIVLIALILLIGLYGGIWGPIPHPTTLDSLSSLFSATAENDHSIGSLAVGVYAAVWAYDGWDNVNYVAGELIHCERDLPRIIHLAMPLVIGCYILVNLAYYAVLTMGDILATPHGLALIFADKVCGEVVARCVSALIALSCMGSLNATVFTATRVTYAAAQRGFLPSWFLRLLGVVDNSSSSSGDSMGNSMGDSISGFTPQHALLLNTVFSIGYTLVGGFGSLVGLYGVASYTFYFLTVAGVLVLKVRESEVKRVYSTWWITPVVFCGVALCLILRGLVEQPVQGGMAFLLMGVGGIIYWWKERNE